MMKEGNKFSTKPTGIANMLNRQYITSIRNTIQNIPQTELDPLIHYKKALGPVNSKLDLQQITMSQLKVTISKMDPTTSSAQGFISMRCIKEAGHLILPHILHMVNSVLNWTENQQF